MKTAIGVIGAAVAASACCIGPVVFSLLGAGALGAASVKLEAYRPWFLGLTLMLVGAAFYGAYRPGANESCATDGTCTPTSKRAAKIMAWIAAAVAVLLITVPYYIGYLM